MTLSPHCNRWCLCVCLGQYKGNWCLFLRLRQSKGNWCPFLRLRQYKGNYRAPPRPSGVAAFMSAHSKTPYITPSMDVSSEKEVVRGRRGQQLGFAVQYIHLKIQHRSHLFYNGVRSGFKVWFRPNTKAKVMAEACLESRIKKFEPFCICRQRQSLWCTPRGCC